uniref:Opa interacting protein 5 n=1 Tax=Coturnix japonica TaxID=93934 RepID=A0A8C2TUP4_COTJA
MAVRRHLQRFFEEPQRFLEEPQIRGTIVVERPLPPEPPPAPPAPAPEAPRCCELRPEDSAVFQCRGCWAVLSDSLHLCAMEEQRLGLLVCLSQCCGTGRGWGHALLLHELILCPTYNTLSCRSCGSAVGIVLYSAFRELAYLRGFFCFFKDSIFCYLLKSKMIIEASKVKFPAVTLKDQMEKVRFPRDFV